MKKLINQAWTVIMVTAISLLVWLYAEDANVKTYNNERVLVKFVPSGEGEMLIEPQAADILVSLSGSNGQFQQFLRGIGDERVVEISVAISPDQSISTQAVDLRRALEDTVLENLGLNLTMLNQEAIDVTVQKVESVTLNVQVLTQGLGLTRDAEPAVPQVTFRLPASLMTDELRNATVPATIDLAGQDLSPFVPGTDARMTLPINLPINRAALPEGFELRPSATETSVGFRLVVQSETAIVERVIVKVTHPASVADRFVIRLAEEDDQVLSNLEVQGPPAQIAELKANGVAAHILATVEITNAEAEDAAAGDGVITKRVQVYINLPGVHLVSEPPRIPIQVRLRDAVDAAP